MNKTDEKITAQERRAMQHAATVSWAVEALYERTGSLRACARLLDQLGMRTASGRGRWTPTSVARVLGVCGHDVPAYARLRAAERLSQARHATCG